MTIVDKQGDAVASSRGHGAASIRAVSPRGRFAMVNFAKKERVMQHKVVATAVVAVMLVGATAFPWGYAGHAYIDDHVGMPCGLMNSDEIYGAMLPDMMNLVSAEAAVPLHIEGASVWNAGRTVYEKALGLGFASHNDVWGADFTAHHRGRTYGKSDGYVIQKVADFEAALPPELRLQNIGIADAVARELYHSMIEFGADLLTAQLDPSIGYKIAFAAELRDRRCPELLVRAFADDLAPVFGPAAPDVIRAAEAEFRETMVQYGVMLTLDTPDAVNAMAQYLATIAEGYLASYGAQIPPGVDVVQLVTAYLQIAMQLGANDYPAEITATIAYVKTALRAQRVDYLAMLFRW
jgi:hypothetical protein